MKININFLVLIIVIIIASCQEGKDRAEIGTENDQSIKKVEMTAESSFRVHGSCGMCKERIEKAAKSLNKVETANWSQETQTLTFIHEKNLDIEKVHEIIAEAGHDTEKMKAENEVYNAIPACCKYRDPE